MTNQQDLMGRIEAAVDYSHNFATAKPNIGGTEKEHILGLVALLREAAAQLGRMESIEPTKDDVEGAEEAYREAIDGMGMATPEWSSLVPMRHALRSFVGRRTHVSEWALDEAAVIRACNAYDIAMKEEGEDVHSCASYPCMYAAIVAAAAQLPAGVPDDVIPGDGHRWGDFSRNELCDEIERLLSLQESLTAAPQPDSKESR